MSEEERANIINTLAWMTGWSEEAFGKYSDEELMQRMDDAVYVEMESGLNR